MYIGCEVDWMDLSVGGDWQDGEWRQIVAPCASADELAGEIREAVELGVIGSHEADPMLADIDTYREMT